MNGSSAGMVVVLELKKISTEQPHLHHYKSGEARYAVLKRTVPEEADSGDTILNSIYICCSGLRDSIFMSFSPFYIVFVITIHINCLNMGINN